MKQRLGKVHWAWVALGVAFVCKEYLIVAQLGRALHSGGARLVLCTAAIFAIASPLLCLRPGGVQVRRLLVLDLLLTFLSYGNLLHYRAFGGLSSVEQLGYMGQLGAVGGAVVSLMEGRDLLLFVDIAALALIALLPFESRWPAMRRRNAWATVAAGVALLALTVTDSPRFATPWRGTTYIVGDIGIPTYHLLDVAKAVQKRALRERPEPATIAELRRHFEENWHEEPASLAGAAKGRNLIVLQLESFQGFIEGLVVDGQEITPNLNALAKESLRFENFYHLAAAGRTSDAQFATNCSLYPKHLGAAAFEYAGNDLYCLPERLEELGYDATFIQSFRPDFWNRAAFNPVQGFSRSLSDRDFVLDEKIGLGLSDASFFRQAVDVIEELRRGGGPLRSGEQPDRSRPHPPLPAGAPPTGHLLRGQQPARSRRRGSGRDLPGRLGARRGSGLPLAGGDRRGGALRRPRGERAPSLLLRRPGETSGGGHQPLGADLGSRPTPRPAAAAARRRKLSGVLPSLKGSFGNARGRGRPPSPGRW